MMSCFSNSGVLQSDSLGYRECRQRAQRGHAGAVDPNTSLEVSGSSRANCAFSIELTAGTANAILRYRVAFVVEFVITDGKGDSLLSTLIQDNLS